MYGFTLFPKILNAIFVTIEEGLTETVTPETAGIGTSVKVGIAKIFEFQSFRKNPTILTIARSTGVIGGINTKVSVVPPGDGIFEIPLVHEINNNAIIM